MELENEGRMENGEWRMENGRLGKRKDVRRGMDFQGTVFRNGKKSNYILGT